MNVAIRSSEEIELLGQLASTEARESFWAFRQHLDHELIKGWWQREVAIELQYFYYQLEARQSPYLLLMSPPQHGKTRQVTDFLGWVAGKLPDRKSIFASYSDELGTGVNLSLQRMIDSAKYEGVFPNTRLSMSSVVTVAGRAQRNSTLLEFAGKKGSFRNTTVLGQINGLGLDLGVVDDPIKGRKEARSKTVRDSTWNWFIDDFFSRFSDGAGLIMIMTRWHTDDPMGRFIAQFPNSRILRYPAIAVEDEEFRKKGEPLFPEHKSLKFLLERKKALTSQSWESLYQQHPIIVGGGLFPIERIKIIAPKVDKSQVKKSVRYWDKAGTAGGGAYTAGVLMHEMTDGRIVVSDVRRGQWGANDREKRIRQTAELDNQAFPGKIVTWIEQEPGSGGKDSAELSVSLLKGFRVQADRVSGQGSKEVRAEPFASQVQGGNVDMCAAEWNRDFLDELESFPNGKYKDQADAASGAFMKLALGGSKYALTTKAL